MSTTTQLRTAQDLWELSDAEEYELIEGELVPMTPPGGEHGEIQASLIGIIRMFALESRAGRVFGDTGYILQRNPDTVLGPDVSFIASDRIPEDRTGYLELAPDLAVKIVSPSNSPGEIERKVAIYLRAGCRAVWVVYPRERRIAVHIPGEPPRVFGDGESFDAQPVLPGLTVPVSSVFE